MRYFCLFIIIFLASCSRVQGPDEYTLLEVKDHFEILYNSWATKSVKEHYAPGSIVLNGSYFWKTSTGYLYPAWLWIKNGKQYMPPQKDDPNLSHVVIISYGPISILPNWESQQKIDACIGVEGCLAFQGWPLVLSGNILQDFGGSWHANEPHERTLIWRTRSWRLFFFVFSRPKTLSEVGTMIAKVFDNDPITLLNLDGWPSTAFYDWKNGFREDEKLPIIFRINS